MTDRFFVLNKLLQANSEKSLTKQESTEYKKVYSFLKRVENHNINENYLSRRFAEMIWRINKGFKELYSDLKVSFFEQIKTTFERVLNIF